MTLFILKPVFWNTQGYQGPSGVQAHSGFPKENGYGHEEWNNSSRLVFTLNGEEQKIFHTEGLGSLPLSSNSRDIFVFMYASHDGLQSLVGIAGNATSLIDDASKDQRSRLVRSLKLNNLAPEAWKIPIIKRAHGGSHNEFLRRWDKNLHWIPNWYCPRKCFFWPTQPAKLNAEKITGSNKLTPRYSSFQKITAAQARSIMLSVKAEIRTDEWRFIVASIERSCSDRSFENADVIEINNRNDVGKTTTKALIDARVGQGRYRRELENIWDGKCSVTGFSMPQLLRASHVKPWSVSNDKERLDPQNGLLLTANLDRLFDSGLVSFNKIGEMLISKAISAADRAFLGIPRKLRIHPSEKLSEYLKYHHNYIFKEM
jgi:hypothetical protein